MAKTYPDEHRKFALTVVPTMDLSYRTHTQTEASKLYPFIRKDGVQQIFMEQLVILQEVSNSSVDAYKLLAQIEIGLHSFVIGKLRSSFGDDEKEWWAKHVSQSTRKVCAERREQDPKRLPVQHYLDLIDLGAIIDKNWELFQQTFPSPYCDNKKLLLQQFDNLNLLRNEIMHPLRGEHWDEDDLQFVRTFAEHVPVVNNRQIQDEEDEE